MVVIHTKLIALVIGVFLVLCLPAEAQKRKVPLRLTDADKKAIVSAVFADGFEELNAKLGGPSILDDCMDMILRDEKVTFVSTKNIESKFVPKIAGVHFEFMTPSEIEDALKTNDQHCYFEFTKFEIAGPKVAVTFGKFLKRPSTIYGEAFS